MRQLIPTPYTVAHISRQVNKSGTKDSHGNYPIASQTAVLRKAQSFVLPGLRGSRQIFNTEAQDRKLVLIHMAVPDPNSYANGDEVLLDPQIDVNGQYVPGTGTAYVVDGDPSDDRLGPWPRYLKAFGGTVKLRRVT